MTELHPRGSERATDEIRGWLAAFLAFQVGVALWALKSIFGVADYALFLLRFGGNLGLLHVIRAALTYVVALLGLIGVGMALRRSRLTRRYWSILLPFQLTSALLGEGLYQVAARIDPSSGRVGVGPGIHALLLIPDLLVLTTMWLYWRRSGRVRATYGSPDQRSAFLVAAI